MESKSFCCYEFGEFRLDARRRSLSKNGEKVPLSARNFDLLVFMVENSGRILEHDELLEKVWVGTFVEQATLKKGISALRQILAEKPENEFIKTIPRRGYSFVSPVRVVPEESADVFVRETEREIIVEELEVTDDEEINFSPTISDVSFKQLPSAKTSKISVSRLAIFSAVGVVALVLAFFAFKPYFAKAVKPEFAAESVRINRVTNTGNVMGTAISADGNYLLYPASEKSGISLWLRQISTGSVNRLTPPENVSFYAFAVAPDNSYVYYILNRRTESQPPVLYKIPLLGGEPQRINQGFGTLAISPDGTKLALARSNNGREQIFITNQNGEDEKIVTTLPEKGRLWHLGWTPDGTKLLCTIRKTVDDKPIYYVAEIALETGAETIILPDTERVVYSATWMPDKNSLLLGVRETNADIRQIWQYFLATQEWLRVTNDDNSYQSPLLTRDGKTIVSTQRSAPGAIWLAENVSLTGAKEANFRQLTGGANNFDRLGLLADGRIAYSITENGKEVISTINQDGSNARQITSGDDGMWLSPSVARNGQSVCFLSSRAGGRQFWRIDADGKNLLKLTATESPIISAQLLRDNSTVIYMMQIKAADSLLFRQTADGQTVQLTESDTGSWTISPDEKFLAAEILNKEARKYRVEVRSLEDGKTINTFDFGVNRQIVFTPDGKNLAYDLKRGDAAQIMIQPLNGGEPYALTDFRSEEIFDFDWSADGTRLAVILGKPLNDAVLIKTENVQ